VDECGNLAENSTGDGAPALVVYDEHADRLHTYCLALLRDHDAAEAATYRTFVLASAHVARLRDPARLLPWLYTLARNECLRGPGFALPATGRRTGLETEETFDSLERCLRRAELRSLRWSAVDGLDAHHREILELSVRHRLDPADISLVLGQPLIRIRALLDAAWHELERGLLAEALARSGATRCAELAAVLAEWDGRMDARARERVLQHADRCQHCAGFGGERIAAATVPGVLPLVPAPQTVRDRLAAEEKSGRVSRRREALVRQGGPFDADGFPARRRQPRRRRPLSERRTWGLIAVGMAAVAAAGLTFGQLHPATGRAAAGSQSPQDGITGLHMLDGEPVGGALTDGASDGATPRTLLTGPAAADLQRAPAAGLTSAWAASPGAAPVVAGQVGPGQPAHGQPGPGQPGPGGRSGAAAGQPTPGPGPRGPQAASGPAAAQQDQLAVTAEVLSRSAVRLTLTARGSRAVSWRVLASAPYLRLSRDSGVLEPGRQVRLTVTVDRDRTPPGDWSADVVVQPGGARLTLSGHTARTRQRQESAPPRSAGRETSGRHRD
jgi:DNA-directed RNA polymerase specialized sigma24 family protein